MTLEFNPGEQVEYNGSDCYLIGIVRYESNGKKNSVLITVIESEPTFLQGQNIFVPAEWLDHLD